MSKKKEQNLLSLDDLVFSDPDEFKTIPLKKDGSEWVKVRAAKTAASQQIYLAILTGIEEVDTATYDKGFSVEVQPWCKTFATFKSRVVDWKITVKQSDGSARDFPFDLDKANELNTTIVEYVAEQIDLLDKQFGTMTGANDPND